LDSEENTAAQYREGIFKLLRSPGIDFKESIPPAYIAGTVIRFVSIIAKFGICTVLDLNGTLLKLKYALGAPDVRILASQKCVF
jgi:hypothetical protein